MIKKDVYKSLINSLNDIHKRLNNWLNLLKIFINYFIFCIKKTDESTIAPPMNVNRGGISLKIKNVCNIPKIGNNV
jgi:hypothetical protein